MANKILTNAKRAKNDEFYMKIDSSSEIVIYESDNGAPRIEVRMQDETAWLSQKQMADLFEKNVKTINEHIKNIFFERELEEDSTIRKFRTVQKEGTREVEREIDYYNLDVIISVGYRVKSVRGTQYICNKI